ncbi:hypothetical protein Q5530_28565 [Saccharothrix sp. BKS2]|uniref:hypothetical protein n=1 Tax=Saccharothrix sp. BKS2 TaxID=3064400 RepID=UPI0039EB6A60
MDSVVNEEAARADSPGRPPGGAADLPPSFDNRVVATTPYRDSTRGESEQMEVHVFATVPAAPAPGRRVRSVKLPAATSSAFAVAVA